VEVGVLRGARDWGWGWVQAWDRYRAWKGVWKGAWKGVWNGGHQERCLDREANGHVIYQIYDWSTAAFWRPIRAPFGMTGPAWHSHQMGSQNCNTLVGWHSEPRQALLGGHGSISIKRPDHTAPAGTQPPSDAVASLHASPPRLVKS
jgi:hypothetical protein